MTERLHAGFAREADAIIAAMALCALGEAPFAVSDAPCERLDDVLPVPRSWLPTACFCGGAAGAVSAYSLMAWINLVDMALNVGGRPLHAAPAFVILTWTTLVLFAGLSTFVGFLVAARLPRYTGPVADLASLRIEHPDARVILVVDVEQEHVDRTRAILRGAP